jgi:PAT family beta-lactamase induction signal transducer AmpG
MERWADILANRRTAALLGLGFLSGVPAAVIDKPLVAWLTDRGATAATVGTLAAWAAVPATVKFAWAPALDRFVPPVPGLGRRRAWLAITQGLLVVGLVGVAVVGPSATFAGVMAVTVAVAFLSASQDVVGDAYRTDVLPAAERGPGTSAWVTGWRVAVIAVGGGIMLAVGRGWLSWPGAYGAAAAVMAGGLAVTVWAPEPPVTAAPPTLGRAVVDPLLDLLRRRGTWAVLLFVVLFKLPERLVAMQTTAFMRQLGIRLETIGWAQNGLGIGATIAGAVAGGVVVARLGLRRSLWTVGVLGAVSNVGFCVLALTGPRAVVYVPAIGVESFCNGMVTAAFVAFLMAQCDARYSATQYALLSGLMRLTDVAFGGAGGRFAVRHGWASFFAMSVAAVVPGLALLPWVPVERAIDGAGFEVITQDGVDPV